MTKYNIKTHLISNINLFPVFQLAIHNIVFALWINLRLVNLLLEKRAWKKSINSVIEQVGVIQHFNFNQKF